MKILFLCQRVPYPPTKGEKIRAYHHLTQLARRHEVHLACLADKGVDEEHVAYLRQRCASVDVVYRSPWGARILALAAIVTGRPLSVAAFASRELRRLVGERLRVSRPDLVFAYSSAMAPYAEGIDGMPRAIDFVDADSEKWRSYGRVRPFPQSALYALEAERLACYEGRVATDFDASFFVSDAEAKIVQRRTSRKDVRVLPMGVDLEYFQPIPDREPPRAPRIVFTGVMGYYPNVDAATYFARDVLPLIRASVPEARFLIVGRDPAAEVRRLGRLPGVEVTGTVPDVRPYLAEAAMAVAPFRIARGVQSKVLEAMASGLPVVGTRLAFQGLMAREEDGVRMADTPEALAQVSAALLLDATSQRSLGRAARLYVERHHHWERLGEQLDRILSALVAPPARTGA
ncbi:MAG: TIGR03087 family PEP-CTERM/XrtA system glycosyltransferase [Candidatus Eisenbacteria bacterium]